MTVEEFRAYVKAQRYEPNTYQWCIANNVTGSSMSMFITGRRKNPPSDLVRALGFQRGVVPLDTTRNAMKGTPDAR